MSIPLFPEPEPGEHPASRSVTEGVHPWAPSSLAAFDAREEFAVIQRARENATHRQVAFDHAVETAWTRYETDFVFHAKARILADVIFHARSNAIHDAIRAMVALEEMEGGILDYRIAPQDPME